METTRRLAKIARRIAIAAADARDWYIVRAQCRALSAQDAAEFEVLRRLILASAPDSATAAWYEDREILPLHGEWRICMRGEYQVRRPRVAKMAADLRAKRREKTFLS